MIAPTEGRVVWFWPAKKDSLYDADRKRPLAAIIATVHSDHDISLMVVSSGGYPTGRSHIFLKHLDSENPEPPYAEWMPYQKGQAAKTEELERRVPRMSDGGGPDYHDKPPGI